MATDRWQRAWCFVAAQKLVDLRRCCKFGELSDERAGALMTVNQMLDAPPLGNPFPLGRAVRQRALRSKIEAARR